MASQLTQTQIIAKKHLQQIIAAAVGRAWASLPHYDQAQVDQFLSSVLPITAAANRQSVMLTEAYLARALGRQPVGVNADEIIAGLRNGATPEDVYKRPFVTVWSALGSGVAWAQAVRMGQQRAESAAATDVQLSFTHTLEAVGSSDAQIVGYERVPDDGACDFCQAAAGQMYHVEDLMPLHNNCGCGVEPVTASDTGRFSNAPDRFPGADGLEVAVRDHGELGPVLTNAADHFTSEADLASAA